MSIYKLHDGREVHYYTESELSLLRKADSALTVLNRRKAERMSRIEDVLWRLFDEERGAFGASGSPTFIAEALRVALLSDETVERAARTITPHLYWKYDKWDEADEEDRELAREIARDALRAMVGDDEWTS